MFIILQESGGWTYAKHTTTWKCNNDHKLIWTLLFLSTHPALPFTYKFNPNVEKTNKTNFIWFAHHFESNINPKILYNMSKNSPLARWNNPCKILDFSSWICNIIIYLAFVVDSESLLQRIALEALIQFQQEIQVVLMLTFP
jgi:hypothetical protein